MMFQRNTDKEFMLEPYLQIIRFVISLLMTPKVPRVGNKDVFGMKKIHPTLISSLLVIGFSITIHGNTGKGNIYFT